MVANLKRRKATAPAPARSAKRRSISRLLSGAWSVVAAGWFSLDSGLFYVSARECCVPMAPVAMVWYSLTKSAPTFYESYSYLGVELSRLIRVPHSTNLTRTQGDVGGWPDLHGFAHTSGGNG